MNKFLETYIEKFKKLRRGVTPYGLAPHKPVLLISVILGFERGIIVSNRIKVDDILDIFTECWKILVPTNHDCNIYLPFWHMATEKFWHLSKKNKPKESLASLDRELFIYLQVKKSRDCLLNVIIETYFYAVKKQWCEFITEPIYLLSNNYPLQDSIPEKLLYMQNVPIDAEIDVLRLKPRERRAVLALGIKYIKDFAKVKIDDFSKTAGIGPKSLEHLNDIYEFVVQRINVQENDNTNQYKLSDLFQNADFVKVLSQDTQKNENVNGLEYTEAKKHEQYIVSEGKDGQPHFVTKSNKSYKPHFYSLKCHIDNRLIFCQPMRLFFKYIYNEFETIERLNLSDIAMLELEKIYFYAEDPLDYIFNTTIEYFFSKLSKKTFCELIRNIARLYSPLIEQIIPSQIKIEASPTFLGLTISSIYLTKAKMYLLHRNGIFTWQDYHNFTNIKKLSASEAFLLSDALISLSEIFDKKILILNKYWHSHLDVYVKDVMPNISDKHFEIFKLRVLEKNTLEDTSVMIGITRERVRQIIHTVNERYFKSAWSYVNYSAFTLALSLESILFKFHGIVSKNELLCEIKKYFEWDYDSLPFIINFIDSSTRIDYDSAKGIFTLRENPCLLCDKILSIISEIKFKATPLTISEINFLCNKACQCCIEPSNGLNGIFATSFWMVFLAKNNVNVILDADSQTMLDSDSWLLKSGTLTEAICCVLKKHGIMHVNSIYSILVKYRPILAIAHIHSAMNRSDFALIKRGTYTLKENIGEVPEHIISEINIYLTRKFNHNIPIINIGAMIDVYPDELKRQGIISDYSLYEALKSSGKINARFIKCPYVTSVENHDRFSIADSIIQYVKDTGAVTLGELRKFFCDQLGISPSVIQMAVNNNLDLMVDGRGNIVLFDELALSHDEIQRLSEYLNEKIKNETITATMVFNDNCVTCRTVGIKDRKMLFYVLKRLFSDKYLFKFPQISALNIDITPVIRQIENYLVNKKTFCAIDELEDEFVKKRGFGGIAGILYSGKMNVFRYLERCIVHHEAIGWDNDKLNTMLLVCQKNLTRSRITNKYYAYIDDIINFFEDDLPILKNQISWTTTLICDILQQNGKFLLLGNYKNIYTETCNDDAISNFGDLCAQILWDEYDGATGVDTFAKYLRDKRLISYQLRNSMLGNSTKVKIADNEIIALRDNQ